MEHSNILSTREYELRRFAFGKLCYLFWYHKVSCAFNSGTTSSSSFTALAETLIGSQRDLGRDQDALPFLVVGVSLEEKCVADVSISFPARENAMLNNQPDSGLVASSLNVESRLSLFWLYQPY